MHKPCRARNDNRTKYRVFFRLLYAVVAAASVGGAGRSKSHSLLGQAITGAAFRCFSTIYSLRTLHADEILLDVLALGISAARGELAVPSVADHHVASALRAKLVEWD